MSMHTLVGGGMRPRARYRARALGGLLLALLMTGAPYVPTAASGEVARTKKDIWATHNVVLINYDPVNKRYRAHCVSVGNSAVKKQILACRLTRSSDGEVRLGKGVGPSYENIRTHSDLLGRKPNSCVVAAMWLKLSHRETKYETTLKTKCYPKE